MPATRASGTAFLDECEAKTMYQQNYVIVFVLNHSLLKNCTLLDYYTASSGNYYLQTFRTTYRPHLKVS
jgi:hypothetical protein